MLADIGAFGGMFRLSAAGSFKDPVLVASTDGIGTKVKVAAALGRYDTLGCDIVNHCVNDIAVQGARPLFFLDYLALHRADPDVVSALVESVATACVAAGCSLLGGETAEMPDVYPPGEFDLAGFIVGVVDRKEIGVNGDPAPVTSCSASLRQGCTPTGTAWRGGRLPIARGRALILNWA